MNNNYELKTLVEEQTKQIFSSNTQLPKKLEVLKKLDVKFRSVEELSEYSKLIDYIYNNNLYKINVENTLYFQTRIAGSNKSNAFEKANFTSLLEITNQPLFKYIEDNIQEYTESVFSLLSDNSEESEDAVIKLISNDSIALPQKEFILNKEKAIIQKITSLPNEIWTKALSEKKIKANWENLEKYLNAENKDEALLNTVLNNQYLEISKDSYRRKEDVVDDQRYIHKYIFSNDQLENTAYSKLLKSILIYWDEFPDVSKDKKIILANNRSVRLSTDSFPAKYDELSALLIEKNYDDYKKDKSAYLLDGVIKLNLLKSDLHIDNKIDLCHDVSIDEITQTEDLAAQMGKTLANNNADVLPIDTQIIKQVVASSESADAVLILNKLIPSWSKEQIITIMQELASPYSQMIVHRKQPVLQSNKSNKILVELLKEKGVISSFKETKGGIRVFTKKIII